MALLDSAETHVSTAPRFLASRPLCRSHLSDRKDKSKKTVVTQQPAMKRGLSPWAPISCGNQRRQELGPSGRSSRT